MKYILLSFGEGNKVDKNFIDIRKRKIFFEDSESTLILINDITSMVNAEKIKSAN
jgi:signal transduction histidine kinase